MLAHFPTVTKSAGFQPEPLLTAHSSLLIAHCSLLTAYHYRIIFVENTIYGKTIGKTLLKYAKIPFFVSSFISKFAKEFKVSCYL